MNIPVLAYQPMRIAGSDYASNPLKALAADLRHLTDAGFRVMPLRSVVDAWLDGRRDELRGRLAAITCESGSDFDFLDLPHPTAGVQRSVLNILRDFGRDQPGRQPALHATSFAVVSPEARAALDAACMLGKGWWSDTWWKPAVESGLMHIASQSWDHNHEALPASLARGVRTGDFSAIDSRDLADHQIRRAVEYLNAVAPNPGAGLFAYPYGEPNAYLAREYFPAFGDPLGIRAAFTFRPGYLARASNRWELPRFLFGRDWTAPEELQRILDGAAEPARAWIPVARTAETILSPPRQEAHATAPAAGAAGRYGAADRITDEGFRARYSTVPRIVAEWVGRHRSLAGLDILDFGCGEGVAALGLALQHGPRRVVGVDIGRDPECCLPLAREQLGLAQPPPNLWLHRVTPGCLHDASDRFDVAFSWSVFEHVDQRLIGPVLRLIRSALRPGGLFFVQIAPLYYSANGAHLRHRIDEPWVHLSTQDDILHERLRAAVSDPAERNSLWDTYRTLNRMTADGLLGHLERNGFEILRKSLMKCSDRPSVELREVYREEVLATEQIVVLARPAAMPSP